MSKINKIKLSGTTYDVEDANASKTVELTQAQYDALSVKDPNTFYIITDGETFDPSSKADTSAFTAHTGDSTIHVTSSEKSTWNAKSDFSGSYNDLTDKPTIPTVPTSNTAFTNDAQYATSGYVDSAVSGKANSSDVYTKSETSGATQISDALSGKLDTTAYTPTDLSNYYQKSETSGATQISDALSGKVDTTAYTPTDLSNYYQKSETSGATQISDALSGKVETSAITSAVTSASTDNEIPTAKAVYDAIPQGGGGKAISAGTNISITTGETADTINCTLNISNGTGGLSIKSNGASSASANHTAAFGQNTKATNVCAFAEGWGTTASGGKSHSEGDQTVAGGGQSHAEGTLTKAMADHSHSEGYASSATSRVTTMVGITTPYGWNTRHSEGYATIADNGCTHTEGLSTKALNVAEHSSGAYNVSYTASTTWGDSGNTLFSVGNGTAEDARHNAFEIRQNGDIYLNDGTNDVKLQDTITATAANTTALGGLKLVKLTQTEYDNLGTKDSNTLYVITTS